MITVKSYSYNPLTTRSFFVPSSRKDYVNSQFCNVSVRLQFENLKCKQSNGIVYFVTFTYNDASVININGYNFANNYDVRFLCNKSILPKHLKDHGYSFKFAFFGEAGDGKGVRGRDNNPHYHALFFLYPLETCDNFYHDQSKFLTLCHNAWNQDSDSRSKKYKELKRGNVSYSLKGAIVDDDKVFSYCSMYCVKELDDNVYNNRVKDIFTKVAFVTLFDMAYYMPLISSVFRYSYPPAIVQSIFKSFMMTYGNKLSILAPYNCKRQDYLVILQDAVRSIFNTYYCVKDYDVFPSWIMSDDIFESKIFIDICSTPLFTKFRDFLVNRHSLRYRLSSELGINGLDYIDNNYFLDVSHFKNFGAPRINLPSYYYRKYLFDMVKFEDHYLYVRNDKFKGYFLKNLTITKCYKALKSYCGNKAKFEATLNDEQRAALRNIPDNVFVEFKPFRGLSFSAYDVPEIDTHFAWRYFKDIHWDKHVFYSIPLSQKYFFDKHGFVDFSLHPYFKYDMIHDLSLLYDKFLSLDLSKRRINDVKDYHKLKPDKRYENYKPA